MLRNKHIVYVVVALVYCFSCTSCTKTGSSPVHKGTGGDAPSNPGQQKLLDLVNEARTTGCDCGPTYYPAVDPVVWSDQLEAAARKHSKYMNTSGNFSHTGEGGSDAGERIRNEGYIWIAYGENIAEGYSTEEAVVQAWLNSEGHCSNIMSANFKEMGVGTSGKYWTQDFGSR